MKLMSYNHPNTAFDAFFGDPFEAFAPLFEMSRRAQTDSSIEWFEDDTHYHARIDLPGVAKDQLNIEFESELITLQVVKSTGDENHYERKIRVPESVADDDATAALVDGVLTLTLPKVPEQQPISIEIS